MHQRKKSVPDKSICFRIEKVSHLQFEKKCALLISTYLQLYSIRVMYFFHQLKLNNCSLDSHLAYTNCAKIKETRLKSIQDSELMLFQGAFSTCFFKIDFSKWFFQNDSFKIAFFFEIWAQSNFQWIYNEATLLFWLKIQEIACIQISEKQTYKTENQKIINLKLWTHVSDPNNKLQ